MPQLRWYTAWKSGITTMGKFVPGDTEWVHRQSGMVENSPQQAEGAQLGEWARFLRTTSGRRKT
jgi:hypothetical protein